MTKTGDASVSTPMFKPDHDIYDLYKFENDTSPQEDKEVKLISQQQSTEDTASETGSSCKSYTSSLSSQFSRNNETRSEVTGWDEEVPHLALHCLELQSRKDALFHADWNKDQTVQECIFPPALATKYTRRWRNKRSFGRRMYISLSVFGFLSTYYSYLFIAQQAFHSIPCNTLCFLEKDRQQILENVNAPRISSSFTIRITTRLNRVDVLQNSLDSHSRCSRVRQIQVIWTMDREVPKSISFHKSGKVKISRAKNNLDESLQESMKTEAVLLMDDDLIFTCDDLDKAFHIWNHNPLRIVGFYPYHYYYSKTFMRSYYTLTAAEPFTTYSIISDRASFVHRSYIKDYGVELSALCRSILLSLQVTSLTKASPIAVDGRPLELKASTAVMGNLKEDEDSDRVEKNSCLNLLMSEFNLKVLPEAS